MIVGYDNISFRNPSQIIGVDVSGFLAIFIENVGAGKIIVVITQGGD